MSNYFDHLFEIVDPDLNNYSPISNLSFFSKTVERLVDARFVAHADKNSLFPVFQSGYRTQHSTETALVHLYNNMVTTTDRGEIGVLVLLDVYCIRYH